MSELIKTNANKAFLREHLLTTVCGVALLVSAAAGNAKAEETDRPTVWIELGGQLESLADKRETFAPPFLNKFDPAFFEPVVPIQRTLRYSNGAEGKISFQPVGSDWFFAASLRYGRSNGHKANYQRLPAAVFPVTQVGATAPVNLYETPPKHLNASATNTERHIIADFQAGKDVGLGMFGSHNASKLSLGVRFAQFTSGSQINTSGVPDFTQMGHEEKYDGVFQSHHRYIGATDTERSFHGIGPSLSWDSSARILGGGDDTEVTFDWGLNGSVLFGRQKVKGNAHTTGSHYKTFTRIKKDLTITKYNGVASAYHHAADIDRSHSVAVPNIGGFAGLSYRYSSAKLSLGYRADFFFVAMDEGIDTRKTENVGFHGPFATVSIGLGG
ncbi:MAG TPA: hypothetical protein VGM36_13070 [Rhizomicrobium sp.]|jgi:hypothetical protein